MANQYYNFYYDPVSQGFDPLAWRALYGTPVISGTRLSVSSSTSTKTGTTPFIRNALAVETNVNAGTMISSPIFNPETRPANSSACVQDVVRSVR